MTRIIIINGSPRSGGNTESICRECCSVIEEAGGECRVFSLRGKRISSCIACGKCRETGFCAFGDDDGINEMIREIRNADGLIVASPVYFGTARGDLMSAIQRIAYVSYGYDHFLEGMVGGPIAVARRGGHTATIQELLMFYFINNMIVAGSSYWNMVFGGNPGEAAGDEEGMDTIRMFAANVVRVAGKLKE